MDARDWRAWGIVRRGYSQPTRGKLRVERLGNMRGQIVTSPKARKLCTGALSWRGVLIQQWVDRHAYTDGE